MTHRLDESPYGDSGHLVRYNGQTYNPYQDALWQAIDDFVFARINGFQDLRQPSPDFRINPDIFDRWRERVVQRWEYESNSRDKFKTRGYQIEDFPDNLWMYLYERMVKAAELREGVVPFDKVDSNQRGGPANAQP